MFFVGNIKLDCTFYINLITYLLILYLCTARAKRNQVLIINWIKSVCFKKEKKQRRVNSKLRDVTTEKLMRRHFDSPLYRSFRVHVYTQFNHMNLVRTFSSLECTIFPGIRSLHVGYLRPFHSSPDLCESCTFSECSWARESGMVKRLWRYRTPKNISRSEACHSSES